LADPEEGVRIMSVKLPEQYILAHVNLMLYRDWLEDISDETGWVKEYLQ
jgi:hypothetical protein